MDIAPALEIGCVAIHISNKPIPSKHDTISSIYHLNIEKKQPMSSEILQVCPSWGTSCGIAEYAKNITYELKQNNIPIKNFRRLSSSLAYIKKSVNNEFQIWLHYEYGLFGYGKTPMFESNQNVVNAITECNQLGIVLKIFMHTVVEFSVFDDLISILASLEYPIYHFSKSGVNYLREKGCKAFFMKHGIASINNLRYYKLKSNAQTLLAGSFGIFRPASHDIDVIIEIVKKLKIKVKLNFFCRNSDLKKYLTQKLKPITEEVIFIGCSYLDNNHLVEFISNCDFLIMPRKPNKEVHFTSGSIRTAIACGVPIIANKVNCYMDLGEAVNLHTSLSGMIEEGNRLINDRKYYNKQILRIKKYYSHNSIKDIWLT